MTPFPAGLSTTWVPVALSRELKSKPLARRVADVPLVLFRGAEGVSVLKDRCPHRNYPLSGGKVYNGTLRCPYHGWRFDGAGRCVDVPGADKGCDISRLGAERIAAVERFGAIFVRLEGGDQAPPFEPPPLLGDPAYDHFWYTRGVWRGRAIDALENILDPFHTNFIHDGLIRDSRHRQLVKQTLAYRDDGLEVTYEQQSPDRGWMPRLLEGERKRSVGRYLAPITFQGRWESTKGLTLCATAYFVPESHDTYRPFGCWTTRKGLAPNWLKRAAIMAFVRTVAEQDLVSLEKQHATINDFGAPKFKSGPTDLVHAPLAEFYHHGVADARPSESRSVWL